MLGVGRRPARIVRLIEKHPTAGRRFVRDDPQRSFLDRDNKIVFRSAHSDERLCRTISAKYREKRIGKTAGERMKSIAGHWYSATPFVHVQVADGFNTFL